MDFTARQSGDRWEAADGLRAAAILGVVAIHATSPFLNDPWGSAIDPWVHPFFVLINQAGRFSVPAFFLLAGIFTAPRVMRAMGDGRSLKQSLSVRLARLVLPYMTWSLVFAILPGLLHGRGLPGDFPRRLLFGWTFTGAYFLVALIQLTILAPLLVWFASHRRRAAWIVCAALGCFTPALYAVVAYGGEPLAVWMHEHLSEGLSLCFVWLPFFLAGILIGLDRDAWQTRFATLRRPAAIVSVASLGSSVVEFERSLQMTGSPGLAAGFLKPSSVALVLAVVVFSLGRHPEITTAPLTRSLASASFPIFLLHGAVILWLLDLDVPGWPHLIHSPAGPVLLGLTATMTPWVVYLVARSTLPRPALALMFGEVGASASLRRDGAAPHARAIW